MRFMITTGGVSAVLVAVNVKPQALAGDDGLLQRVPVLCHAEGSEWSCVLFSTAGAGDGTKRIGGPVSASVQQVIVNQVHVKKAPSDRDVLVWGRDKIQDLLSAVCIPRFPEFAGCTGGANIELDYSVVCDIFPVWNRGKGFCLLLHCCSIVFVQVAEKPKCFLQQ